MNTPKIWCELMKEGLPLSVKNANHDYAVNTSRGCESRRLTYESDYSYFFNIEVTGQKELHFNIFTDGWQNLHYRLFLEIDNLSVLQANCTCSKEGKSLRPILPDSIVTINNKKYLLTKEFAQENKSMHNDYFIFKPVAIL